DAAAAYESVLVEIRAAGCDRAQVGRKRRRTMPGRAAEVGAARDTDRTGAEGLLRKPFRHVVRILRFRSILKAAPRTERCAAAAGVDRGDDIAMLEELNKVAVLDGTDLFARGICVRAPVRRVHPHDGKALLDRPSIDRGPIDVDGKLSAVAHGDVLRGLDPFGIARFGVAAV